MKVGELRTLAAAHRDHESDDRLRELRRQLISGGSVLGAPEVLASGRTKVCHRFEQRDHYANAKPEVRGALEELNIRSYILTPMRARGRTLGTLCVASTVARMFDEAEVTLVEELAQRAGLALDNAALFQAAEHAREKAERASQAKDQFLAMLSHELRTPLTPVLNTVALLELDDTLSEDVRSSIEVIRRNVELEARLIDDLLDLTRVSKGKVQLNLETADAHALLNSALEICRSETYEKQIEVVVDLRAKGFHLLADPARLQQVFWNLIKNAVKFTSCAGQLTLSTENDPNGNLRVEVADTGIGIEPDSFPGSSMPSNRWVRASVSAGSALGSRLQGARRDAWRRGHCLQCWSRLRRQVHAHFPHRGCRARGAESCRRGADSEHLQLRVLLVEDHEDTNRSLSRLLVRRGYDVRAARTLEDALATARAFEFDILISDMGLPDGSGIQLMQQLSGIRSVRGIALSGYGMEEDIQRSMGVGYREHLTKPVDIGRLDEAIQRIAREN